MVCFFYVTQDRIMSSLRTAMFLLVVLMVLIDCSTAIPAADKERLLNEVDVSNEILPPPFTLAIVVCQNAFILI